MARFGHESWFYFRLPGTRTVWGCREAVSLLGLTPGGFVVYPFMHPGPHAVLTLVPAPGHSLTRDVLPPEDLTPMYDYLADSETTPRDEHRDGVREIVKSLGGQGKTVLARMIRVDGRLDMRATFESLCEAYPSAFVFLFSSLLCGTWIGASPELLLSVDEERLHTMSLAGTRPAGTGGDWDAKNVEEQALVTRFITSTLKAHSLSVVEHPASTLMAGPVEHICTRIEAPLTDSTRVSAILTDLSPTPAVFGSNRLNSLAILHEVESFDRRYYGGFSGPYFLHVSEEEALTRLYVNLRTAYVDRHGVTLYSGSGITPLSTPDDEWEETGRKAQTLISKLKFIEKR